jgi:membrane protein DedA with SNARE-associated domain
VTDRIIALIQQIGELGVGLLILLETVLPPIPSEVVLPFAGFAAADGRLNPYLAWLAATVGSLLGAYLLYWLGAALSYERLHHLAGKPWFFLLGQRDLQRGQRFFEKHGQVVILVGRFIPFIRSVVSVPAGLTRMPLLRFGLLTLVGSGLWNAAFIYAGYRLGEDYAAVEGYLGPASKAVTAVIVVVVIWLVVRRVRERRMARGHSSVGAGPRDGS